MKLPIFNKPINLVISRSLSCKFERQFKRARRLYVFLNRKSLYKNPSLICAMAENGMSRGLWSPGYDTQARVSILNNLYRIENPTIMYINHTKRWREWIDKSPWELPDALPKYKVI